MNTFNIFKISLLTLFITSCGSDKKANAPKFSLEATQKGTFKLGETLKIIPKSKANTTIDSVKYKFQHNSITLKGNAPFEIKLSTHLLGNHKVSASVFSNGSEEKHTQKVIILNNKAPKIYGYNIINTYPHNKEHYTQGLEFKGDNLYESAGHYKHSKLLQKNLKTGKTIKEHALKDNYFAEGLTIIGNKIHQLTWREDIGFTYDIETFKELGSFAYNKSKQGWGLCHSDQYIYKSDGTTKIWKLNKETLAEEGFIEVATNTAIKSKFNELEWVNGKIYANTYQKPSIAIINPKNGAIEGIINLKGLLKEVNVDPNDADYVLNGIAFKPETNQLYVTGKFWNSLFEIEIVE
ncbi:glutaminyl-peptide cyclotransferase [Aquimarina agarilytica]|uniref:glutaminyl-peptide cyclotransferase n=1 Tax=Aquimarina agarilytica TaxID=1087449 RepID=UPI0002890111|nr:glutaminyl-peptide cyclotransferase [Aquimarina agarilytica]